MKGSKAKIFEAVTTDSATEMFLKS